MSHIRQYVSFNTYQSHNAASETAARHSGSEDPWCWPHNIHQLVQLLARYLHEFTEWVMGLVEQFADLAFKKKSIKLKIGFYWFRKTYSIYVRRSQVYIHFHHQVLIVPLIEKVKILQLKFCKERLGHNKHIVNIWSLNLWQFSTLYVFCFVHFHINCGRTSY